MSAHPHPSRIAPTALIDVAKLDRQLGADEPPIDLFRQALAEGTEALWARFRDGIPADELTHERARLIDTLLERAWRLTLGRWHNRLTLLAVGGYGRSELYPHSDIDLAILLPEADHGHYRQPVEQFLTLLWDIGLQVGHSTRTIDDCVIQATQDITVATNLMEARFLDGTPELFTQMQRATGPDQIWPSPAFFQAKTHEQQQRHHRFHDTTYNLEPNIKEGPGGLRDIHVIGWVAKRHFGADTFSGLVEHEFLTQQEHKALLDGHRLLAQIRFALHAITDRREDRLLFEYQRELAELFGYEDRPHALAVEQFMQSYYRTITELNRLNEMLLQLFQEAILSDQQESTIVPINRRFQARGQFVEVTDDRVFQRYPYALLEVFLILAQNRDLKGIRASTIRLIRDHCHLIDEQFRSDVRARSLFMEILRQPGDIGPQLAFMNRYGVLAAYIPAFATVVGQMQFDLFHAYTVDQHTVFVMSNASAYADPDRSDELPLCREIFNRLPKQELLYLAALFHDIAKGRGGDHSHLGAEDAEAFCQAHGLSAYDSHLVTWLVRHHLTLSVTAQRRDISDPDIIGEFARTVGDQVHLDFLYLLTVADIRGTNPNLWNSWKAALLLELYTNTKRALRRGLEHVLDQSEFIRETKTQARYLLHQRAIDEETIDRIWADFPDEYFLRYSADEIAWHTGVIEAARPEDLPLVAIRQQTHRGGTAIFLYSQAQDHLFALTTNVLDQLGLDIQDARIITSESGYTVDTYIVLEESGQRVSGKFRENEILTTLQERLHRPTDAFGTVSRHPPRHIRQFLTPTEVRFHQDPSNRRTILEIHTTDRPGLLSKVAQAFLDGGIRLHNAKVSSLGMRTEDIFYITDEINQPVTDPAQLEDLRARLVRYLDESLPKHMRESMKANIPQRAGK